MRLFLKEGDIVRRNDRAAFINDVRNAVLSVLSDDDSQVRAVIEELKAR